MCIYAAQRRHRANVYLSVTSSATALQGEERESVSSWFPQALSSTEPELEHSMRWTGCSSLTMVGCVQSGGMPSKGGSFALHELHGVFTEISQK